MGEKGKYEWEWDGDPTDGGEWVRVWVETPTKEDVIKGRDHVAEALSIVEGALRGLPSYVGSRPNRPLIYLDDSIAIVRSFSTERSGDDA
jgi:hypothetical protein